jgi:RNA polymerase sigma-70 factor (ECF subfamily)
MDDIRLVQLSLENKEAFYYLVKRYEDKLLRYINRLTNIHTDEAEDILQDIFIKVYRNLNGFDQNLSFSSWIYRIAHNEIINHYHRNKRRLAMTVSEGNQDELNSLTEIINEDPNSHEQLIAQENALKIRDILDELPEKYREVLILFFLEEMSYNEISDVLRKPPGTIATLINRGKKKFKKIALKNNLITDAQSL